MKLPGQSLPESGTKTDFKAAVMGSLAIYGIWDTVDKCWLGTANGPLTYQDDMMARVAMTLINMRFGTTTRYRKVPLWEDDFNLKDVVTPQYSLEEVMQKHDM
jgi:hypothetical protein